MLSVLFFWYTISNLNTQINFKLDTLDKFRTHFAFLRRFGRPDYTGSIVSVCVYERP